MSPLDTAVYWVERTARLGHVPDMGTPAKDLPGYQLALLDVAATIFLIMAIIVIFLLIVLKMLLGKFLIVINSFFIKKVKEH